jgi:hypothetical protein
MYMHTKILFEIYVILYDFFDLSLKNSKTVKSCQHFLLTDQILYMINLIKNTYRKKTVKSQHLLQKQSNLIYDKYI